MDFAFIFNLFNIIIIIILIIIIFILSFFIIFYLKYFHCMDKIKEGAEGGGGKCAKHGIAEHKNIKVKYHYILLRNIKRDPWIPSVISQCNAFVCHSWPIWLVDNVAQPEIFQAKKKIIK